MCVASICMPFSQLLTTEECLYCIFVCFLYIFFCMLHLSVVFYTVLCELRLINTVCQKTSIFLFFLYTCPPRLYTVATLPWEIQKSHFSTVLFIQTSDYLRYLRRKQTVTPYPPYLKNCYPLPTIPEKMSPHYLVKCKVIVLSSGNVGR